MAELEANVTNGSTHFPELISEIGNNIFEIESSYVRIFKLNEFWS